jgi:tRNA modification GTPase
MYNLDDTIVAVSSPASEQRVIVRVAGQRTLDEVARIFRPAIPKERNSVTIGSVTVEADLQMDAKLYLFLSPHSYTGDTLAEIHIYTNPAVVEALIGLLLGRRLRMAGPGEFTARAYLNGKVDLAQAEAVAKIVASSNQLQLAAAEKLLAGRLSEATAKAGSSLMDCLSLIEAGIDFSGEDIEFIKRPEAIARLNEIKTELEQLLAGSISYESVIDLPSVGIVGTSNAGKSSLLNKLLGQTRSIVSARNRTTRDVLTGLLTMAHGKCVLFDCAGLMLQPDNILDQLAQAAAIEAVQNSSAVVFCVDISKPDWSEDTAVEKLVGSKILIPVATKSDLLSKEVLAKRLAELNKLFVTEFLPTSVKTGTGVQQLRNTIDGKLIELAVGSAHCTAHGSRLTANVSGVALTARHKQAVTEAVDNISESVNEIRADNDEIAAMLLRAAYQSISDIEHQHIDEQVLDKIFSRFCVGK